MAAIGVAPPEGAGPATRQVMSDDAAPDAAEEALRVGVDLASVTAVAQSIAEFGSRYLERVFTPHEQASASGSEQKRAESLAARFAAKEATLKVLRPTGQAIPWHCIEVRTNEHGAGDLSLSGAAADLAASQGLYSFALSMSHEEDMAVAVVIARVRAANAP